MPLYLPRTYQPNRVAGNNYMLFSGTPSNAAIPAINIIYFYPFTLETTINFSAATVRVVTGGAGSSIKCGIYAASPVSARPLGAPLFKDDTGVTTAVSGVNVVVALGAGSIGPGTYFWGTKCTGTMPTCVGVPAIDSTFSRLAGIPTASSAAFVWASFADTYSNNMPTMAEGASFTYNNSAGCPIGHLTAA